MADSGDLQRFVEEHGLTVRNLDDQCVEFLRGDSPILSVSLLEWTDRGVLDRTLSRLQKALQESSDGV